MNRRGTRPERRPRAHARGREGFTLVELLLGLAVLGIFAGVMTAVLTGTSRLATRATRSLVTGRALLTLQGFLQQELRDADSGDVAVLSNTRVALPRPVGEAMPCAISDTSVLIADSAWVGVRLPEAVRDDVWLLVDPVAGTWQATAITAVVGDRCPTDNATAIRLSLAAPATGEAMVRVMEPVELSAYRSGFADWFGLTPASRASVVQPFAGPLAPSTTRWTLYPDRLETVLQPNGGPATTVTIPLAPGP